MKIIIRPHTPGEEFNYLAYVTNKMDFYDKNGYNITLPKHPPLRKAFDKEDQTLFDVFEKKEYTAEFFEKGIKYLDSKKELVETCLQRLKKYNELWEFKIFEEYNVCLTKYGPGGSYNTNKGKVIMLLKENGTFIRSAAEDTIIHEIVHIGLQKNIVSEFGLNHWEKETLVDLFIKILFGDLIPDYIYKIKSTNIEKNVTGLESLENLPDVMKKFVKQFPRKTN